MSIWTRFFSVLMARQEPQRIPRGNQSPNFSVCIDRVLSHEGGYVNHPNDPGGATNFGITQATARRHGYDGDMRQLPREKAISIYKNEYWAESKADQMPQAVAFQYFDACVNHGLGRAAKLLQEALGVTVDGQVGPQTIASAKAINPGQFVALFNARRISFYTSIANFNTFGKGWMNRVSLNLKWGAGDVG